MATKRLSQRADVTASASILARHGARHARARRRSAAAMHGSTASAFGTCDGDGGLEEAAPEMTAAVEGVVAVGSVVAGASEAALAASRPSTIELYAQQSVTTTNSERRTGVGSCSCSISEK